MLSSSISVIGVVSYLRVIISLDRSIQWLCGIISCSCWPCEKHVRLKAPMARFPHGLLIQAQVIGCGQQLETKLYRNVHVGHVFAVLVTVPVMEVLNHFVKHQAAIMWSASSNTVTARPFSRRSWVSSSVVQDQPDQPVSPPETYKSGRDSSVLSKKCSWSCRHPLQHMPRPQMVISFLTSSLGTHISRPWPRRIDSSGPACP